MTYPIRPARGDAMDKFVLLRGEEALARLMGVSKAKRQPMPKMGHKVTSRASNKKRTRVLKVIRQSGPLTRLQIAEKTKLTPTAVGYSLSTLFQANEIEKVDPEAKHNVLWQVAK